MTLRVGHIAYANCVPFFHHLRDCGFSGEIVPGVPAALNAQLASGAIDLAPSSSFEYARNWQHYRLLPDLSISACGPVRSVLLFAPRPPAQLAGAEIVLSAESATSVNLLQVLLREFHGNPPLTLTTESEPAEAVIAHRLLPGGDWETLVESIRALLDRFPPDTVVYSGHGPETTLGAERATNPFLAELRVS